MMLSNAQVAALRGAILDTHIYLGMIESAKVDSSKMDGMHKYNEAATIINDILGDKTVSYFLKYISGEKY